MSLAVDNPAVDSALEERDRPKVTAAQRWLTAVNHHGGFGTWALSACREPRGLERPLQEFSSVSVAFGGG